MRNEYHERLTAAIKAYIKYDMALGPWKRLDAKTKHRDEKAVEAARKRMENARAEWPLVVDGRPVSVGMRGLFIIYGLIRGRTRKQIENKPPAYDMYYEWSIRDLMRGLGFGAYYRIHPDHADEHVEKTREHVDYRAVCAINRAIWDAREATT